MAGRQYSRRRGFVTKNDFTAVQGSQLRRLREQKGWTRATLAARASVGVGTICRLESGSDGLRTRTENVKRLARALGCAWHRLTFRDGTQ